MENIFFNAHHSPIGAFATFTLGHKGASGGFGLELEGPAGENVYIGIESKENSKIYHSLPFFEYSENDSTRFNQSGPVFPDDEIRAVPFDDKSINREYNLATDQWRAEDLTFKIFSPAGAVPDPSVSAESVAKKALVPAVFVELTIDNTACNRKRSAFFGFTGEDRYTAMRRIDGNGGGLKGVAQGRIVGILSDDKDVVPGLGFTIEDLLGPRNKKRRSFGLGKVGALIMELKPGECKTFRFALCFYRGGTVTSGIDASYYYTKFFSDLESVAQYALSGFAGFKAAAQNRDEILDGTEMSDQRKFMLIHSTRSYYGSTELLRLRDNTPLWVVNEGEYRMMNTLDLTIDQLFYELNVNPWTVCNVLDFYAQKYSYRDSVRSVKTGKRCDGGVSFTHDMGVGNVFSSQGTSAYELPGLDGCFSYMTHEQLVNWVLAASVYGIRCKDSQWLRGKGELLEECLRSMVKRDGGDECSLDGVMDLDSVLTGSGEEITTYDNIDHAMGRARRSSYLALKSWASYCLLGKIFREWGRADLQKVAHSQALKCSETIMRFTGKDGKVPALLEKGCKTVSISTIEGLIFPWFIGDFQTVSFSGPYAALLNVLKVHVENILNPAECLFGNGGWKLSSTSDNTWLSKIYLCQFIAEHILGVRLGNREDSAHVSWLLDENNSFYAWSDQIRDGVVSGSRYYPRGVTSWLWLEDGK